MKNTIANGVQKYWWVPVCIFNVVILGLFLKQQRDTLLLQNKVIKKSFKFHMLREKEIYREELKVVAPKEVLFPVSFCGNENNRRFIIVFLERSYVIGIIPSREDYIPNTRGEFVVEEGSYKKEGNSIYLKEQDREGSIIGSKKIDAIGLTKDRKNLKHLNFYGEVLSIDSCSFSEEKLLEKFLVGYKAPPLK